jgi:hypothetical protein
MASDTVFCITRPPEVRFTCFQVHQWCNRVLVMYSESLEGHHAKIITWYKINKILFSMSIVPRIPAYFANVLLAYWAAQARRSTFPHPLSYRTLLSLLSKAHFAVLWILTNVHTILGAFRCPRPLSAFELYNSTLYPSMLNAIRMIIQTKITPLAITRYKCASSHLIRTFIAHPIQTNTIIQHINAQVNLKVRPSRIFVAIFFPAWLPYFYFCCNTQPPQTMYALPYLTPNTVFEYSSDWFGW